MEGITINQNKTKQVIYVFVSEDGVVKGANYSGK